MKKYARTKDNKIIKIDTENDVFTSKYEIVGELKDNLEDLCDVFEVVSIYFGVLPDLYYHFNKKKLLEELNSPCVKGVYGCIYKQIDDFNAKNIPVCKLNKDGELELI